MDDVYVIVVALSAGMVLTGAAIIAIARRPAPVQVVEWKNPSIV